MQGPDRTAGTLHAAHHRRAGVWLVVRQGPDRSAGPLSQSPLNPILQVRWMLTFRCFFVNMVLSRRRRPALPHHHHRFGSSLHQYTPSSRAPQHNVRRTQLMTLTWRLEQDSPNKITKQRHLPNLQQLPRLRRDRRANPFVFHSLLWRSLHHNKQLLILGSMEGILGHRLAPTRVCCHHLLPCHHRQHRQHHQLHGNRQNHQQLRTFSQSAQDHQRVCIQRWYIHHRSPMNSG